jgi:hypothetical protein
MATAITIIMVFSIKVASVMGNFKAVPKQAQLILFLLNKLLITPTVVVDNMTSVITKAQSKPHLNRNISPNIVSIKG